MDNAYPGPSWQEEAYVTDIVLMEEIGQMAVGLADGRIIFRLIDKPEHAISTIKPHDGLTALRKGFAEDQLFSIGEDGKVMRIDGGQAHEIASFEKAWLEQIALYAPDELIAVSYKKTVVLMDAAGTILHRFSDHPSSVAGLCFDAKGKRVAAAHYNGVSLWWVKGEATQKPQRLGWKGSHTCVNWSPNGKYILSVMQENALHGWRLPDFDDFAMSGYAIKPKSISWDESGRWLASSGASGIVCWDCGGKGPMGRPATVLGEQCPDISVKVACHPELPLIAAGTAQGLVYAARFEDQSIVWMDTKARSEITSLGWSESGAYLYAACENGQAYIWRFLE